MQYPRTGISNANKISRKALEAFLVAFLANLSFIMLAETLELLHTFFVVSTSYLVELPEAMSYGLASYID